MLKYACMHTYFTYIYSPTSSCSRAVLLPLTSRSKTTQLRLHVNRVTAASQTVREKKGSFALLALVLLALPGCSATMARVWDSSQWSWEKGVVFPTQVS